MANLIELFDYKSAQNITGTKDDVRLDSLITSVSQLVKTYCGNAIVDYYSTATGENKDKTKTETLSINWGSHIVQLTESPIGLVHSVKERKSLSSAYTTLVTDVDYYVDSSTDSIYRVTSGGQNKHWAQGPGAVQVEYNAGYATCPEDLKLAVIDLVTYYHKDEHKSRQTIAGASIQNTASTSQRNNIAFPDHIKRVLDLYKTF